MKFELSPQLKLHEITNAQRKDDLLALNETSAEYGLVLSEQEAEMLVQAGRDAIALQDRIEFGKSATTKMIEKFMHSSYLSQNGYADTIAALLEVFYEVKEESLDILTDDEVIQVMYDLFEGESGGDVEILRSRDLEELCRRIRNAANGIAEE